MTHTENPYGIKALVATVVKFLVDNPDEVSVTELNGQQAIIIELKVAPSDLGKVIGKEGRTARALRTLVHASASKQQKRAVLEIIE